MDKIDMNDETPQDIQEMLQDIQNKILALQNAQREILKIISHIDHSFQPLQINVHNLPPQWMGNSAEQFFGQFGEVEGTISEVLEILSEIISALADEIVYWESVLASLI